MPGQWPTPILSPPYMRIPWNKGRDVGQRRHLEAVIVAAVLHYLSGIANLRDRALFMTAVDSLLRCSDLLALRVVDVVGLDGQILSRQQLSQQKTRVAVYPTLTPLTCACLTAWIKASGKGRQDFLFTAKGRPNGRALCRSHYAELIKHWVKAVGIDPVHYSTHSLRRTKPVFMWRAGVRIEYLQRLLGHASKEATIRYLGLDDMEAQALALHHDIFAVSATGAPKKP
jgi:integrase